MLDVVLVFVATLLAVRLWTSGRQKDLPPSPGLSLPVIGHLYLLKGDPMEKIKEWRKKLGDLLMLQLGQQRVIFINGYDAIHEVLVKQHIHFLERPSNFMFDEVFERKGVTALGGKQWKEHRTFLQSTLRALGMGKNVMAERINTEVEYLLAAMTETEGEPTNFDHMISVCVSNIICGISFGQRFDHNDDSLMELLKIMNNFFRNLGSSSLLNFLPFLRHVPGDPFHYKELVEQSSALKKWMWEKIKIDERDLNNDHDSFEDVAQAFVVEIAKKKKGEASLSTTDEVNIICTIAAISFAGTESVKNTLIFALFYMIHFPDIQERLFQEIKEIVGTSRLPTLADKAKLKYLSAFIMETQRYLSLGPMSLARLCTKDVRIKDYIIPKGSSVIAVADSVLWDKDVWGDPQNFRPDRFLTSNEEDVKRGFIPFSLGHRNCPGEALAVMELYLFLSALIQRFQFQSESPNQKPSLIPITGLSRSPKSCQLRALLRSQLE